MSVSAQTFKVSFGSAFEVPSMGQSNIEGGLIFQVVNELRRAEVRLNLIVFKGAEANYIDTLRYIMQAGMLGEKCTLPIWVA